MIVVAFAVTDAEGGDIDADFYGFSPQLVTFGRVATVVIDHDEPPAATDETLLAHHRMIESIAAERACLPHRFGLVVDEDRLRDDMKTNHDALANALDGVRGRSEWMLRSHVRPTEAAQNVVAQTSSLPETDQALDVGRWVHTLVSEQLGSDIDALISELTVADRPASGMLHKDGLGFDIDFLAANCDSNRVPNDIDRIAESVSGYLDLELFGPTPAYRASDRLTVALS